MQPILESIVMTPDPTLIEQAKRLLDIWDAAPRGPITDEQGAAHAELCNMGPELARAAIATLQGSAALPSEAITPEMLKAGMKAFGDTELVGSKFTERALAAAYTAMRATTPTAPDQDTGASVPDQALAVPVEPVARLDPPGFDPSRVVAVEFIEPSIVVEQQGYDGCCTGDKYIWVRHEGRPHLDALLATVHYNYAYHDNCTIRGVAERVANVLAGRGPAIATEAQRAMTVEHGSIHEGAGPEDIAHD